MNFDPNLVKKALDAVPYPIGKSQLIQLVRQHGVNDQVVGTLELLPDKTFNSSAEVQEMISKGSGNLGSMGKLGGLFK